MRKLKRTTEIDAKVDKVYEFITQPENLLRIWPSLVEVTNVERRADGWHSFDWVYKMAGIRFHGNATTVRVDPGKYIEVKNEGGIPSVFKWTCEANGTKTRLTEEVDYTIPAPILGKLAEALVVKMNEHEMQTLHQNLKLLLEEGTKAQPTVAARSH